MEGPAILLNDPVNSSKKPVQDFQLGWGLLLVLGWVFTVIGLLNIVLVWIPLQIGNAEYEFASAANALDSLPVPVMGLVFALAASRARGQLQMARFIRVIMVLLAVLILAAGLLYWLNVPLALKAVQEPMIRLGIKKSILKVTVQSLIYPASLLGLARMSTRG